MKRVFEVVSYLSLVAIVSAPVLFYAEKMTTEMNKTIMLIATIAWFASALGWMGREKAAGK
jgi:hypothetical protein